MSSPVKKLLKSSHFNHQEKKEWMLHRSCWGIILIVLSQNKTALLYPTI